MAGGFSKIVLANAVANTVGGAYQPVVLTNVGAGNATALVNAQYIPSGTYTLLPQANVVVEFNAYTGSANAWSTMIANNTGGTVISDGFSFRANVTSSTANVTLYTVNGGNAATGTFNAS
jgi:hypothetical protein